MKLTPCAAPSNNPEDWFIERDGKQYSDDQLVTEADLVELGGLPPEATPQDHDAVMDALEEQAKRAALVRRRHAKDACHRECHMRLQCLGLAIDGEVLDVDFGIRGGYYPEELRQIVKVRDERS